MDLPRFVIGKVFFDAAIDVTDHTFRDCVFDGCVLVCRKGRYTVMRDCLVTDCRMIGDGWPPKVFGQGLVQ
jgi:hypothetical protein